MAAQVEITDLDILAAVDRRVRLGGATWKVPGDPPSSWLLSFRQLQQALTDPEADDFAVVESLHDALVDLLLIRQPDQEDAAIAAVGTLGVKLLLRSVNEIYRDADLDQAADPEADEVPPTPPTGGTPTRRSGSRPRTQTPRRRTASSGSASSSSSAS